ncbi:hypothetical protein Q5P01_016065 [Channa striata]|uniref:Uncharacterized protein n=1 Tax=Channa striata TaxID=64152 RepID=A0AA88MFM0_CHASR|nr:hypothetical protein Q5P01_016065 [Channa striata]
MPIMHQQVKSADKRHFNRVFNEARGKKQKCQERNMKSTSTRKTILRVATQRAALSSLCVLCCPSEELEEIACDCSLKCSTGDSDYTEKGSQRRQSDAIY